MDLTKKVLCIIGGSGYVGQNIAKFALEQGIKVYAVSRGGRPAQNKDKHKEQIFEKINWVKGDAMHPEKFADIISESNYFVHTVGTLIDSSILKNRKPGDQGTYEQMNRDTAIAVGKKLVYLSASKSPPFIPRYLSTKQEAEKFLLEQQNLKTTILKPGFIYSYKERKWSVPLKFGIDIWSKSFGTFYEKFVPKNTFMNQVLQEFNQDHSIALDDLTVAAVVAAINPQFDGKILYNKDMEKIKSQFDIYGQLSYK